MALFVPFSAYVCVPCYQLPEGEHNNRIFVFRMKQF